MIPEWTAEKNPPSIIPCWRRIVFYRRIRYTCVRSRPHKIVVTRFFSHRIYKIIYCIFFSWKIARTINTRRTAKINKNHKMLKYDTPRNMQLKFMWHLLPSHSRVHTIWYTHGQHEYSIPPLFRRSSILRVVFIIFNGFWYIRCTYFHSHMKHRILMANASLVVAYAMHRRCVR